MRKECVLQLETSFVLKKTRIFSLTDHVRLCGDRPCQGPHRTLVFVLGWYLDSYLSQIFSSPSFRTKIENTYASVPVR